MKNVPPDDLTVVIPYKKASYHHSIYNAVLSLMDCESAGARDLERTISNLMKHWIR